MARIVCRERRPQMGAVRPGVFRPAEPCEPTGHVLKPRVPPLEGVRRVRLLERHVTAADAACLETARVVASGGQGIGGPGGFQLLHQLAVALGGMSAADTLAAINCDPQAPLLSVADYGIVGEVEAAVPALLHLLKDDHAT